MRLGVDTKCGLPPQPQLMVVDNHLAGTEEEIRESLAHLEEFIATLGCANKQLAEIGGDRK